MKEKANKYAGYIKRFLKSNNKKAVVHDLTEEIEEKGLITGIKSLLHKKSPYYVPEIDTTYDHFNIKDYSIQDYNKNIKRFLPAATTPEISIIIPVYNQLDFTYNCICSIIEHNNSVNYEIIVANDNPLDDCQLLREDFENIKIWTNTVNLGFLKNCNAAAAIAKGKYIVFLNNDTQVQQGWLEELLFIFRQYPKAGMAGSMLIYPDGRLQEAGGIIWNDGSGANYGHSRHPAMPEYNYVKPVDYISGASIMIDKKLWDDIGGFDEQFAPAYCEDSDLCFEVRKRGYEVFFQPFSKVVHFEGASHGTDLDSGVKSYQKANQIKLFNKWKHVLQAPGRLNDVFFRRDRSEGKRHVLVVDHYVPEMDKDAGSRTISNFIDSLLSLGYHVKFLGDNNKRDFRYRKPLQLKGVEILYGKAFYFHRQAWRFYLHDKLGIFDAVLMSRSSVCKPLLEYLQLKAYKGKVIYYGHDLGFLRVEKEAKEKNDKQLYKEAALIKANEDYMYRNATYALGISYDEMAYLRKYIKTPLQYIPPYFFDVQDNTTLFEQRVGLFFIGGFAHGPNRDAIKWFMENVYPLLDNEYIPFTIAGSHMPEFILAYKENYPLLSVLPDISAEKLEELYSQTRLVVVPLTNGAGVKGKVIEAMAKGVPVAGTDIAFEGMPKDELFLYKGFNEPNALAEHIISLYNDKAQWKKLSDFGKEYVKKNFNEEAMEKVFKTLIEN